MKNRNDMFERLIRAARRIPEDPSSPYAFEKRIMAQIQSIRPVDAGTFWALGLWKATVPCLALMLCTTFCILGCPLGAAMAHLRCAELQPAELASTSTASSQSV